MEITFGFVVFLLVVEFGAFFIKGIAGFGDALVSPPLLSLTELTPTQIGPMNLLLNWPVNLYIAFKNRKSFSIKKTIPIIVFILIGQIPGIIYLKYASSWVLKAALGLVVLLIGIEMLTRKEPGKVKEKTKRSAVVMALVSLVTGFFAGLFGISILVVAYIERTGYIDKNQFRGQVCFVFFIENTARIILYVITGLYNADIFKLSLIAAIGGFAGIIAGSKVDTKLSEVAVKRIIIIVFMCAGLSALVWALISRA